MDSERWQEVKKVLNAASQLEPQARPSFVEHACGDDGALRREVASLLAFHDQSGEIVDRPVFDVNAGDPFIDRRIGHYRIVRLLGHGGMGKVYLASREDDYAKPVAIKLIQRGLDAEERIARFHEERQILAGLDHPSIARLLDGGTVDDGTMDDGLPYLVMELVEGEPIDRYCDARRLGVRQRLELLRQVLPAVEFSHRRLVVHRDLKPGNILVTAEGTPKLIDFGIAKLLQPSGNGAAPDASRPRRRPMSPRYASPEQIRGEPVTTASDVYSLGVLLYELLSGHHPYRVDSTDPEELERVICASTPIVPSATARTLPVDEGDDEAPIPDLVAWARNTTPQRLERQLFDEIDAIVMKAMRKAPEERYASVAELGDDIDGYLRRLPVRARTSSPAYRLRKFVRRHRKRLAVAVLALMVYTSSLAIVASYVARERTRTHAAADFVSRILRDTGPDRSGGEELTVRKLLDRVSDFLGTSLEDHPLMRAQLLGVVGRTFMDLGDWSRAEGLLEEALEIQRVHGPEDDEVTARRENDLGTVLSRRGDLESAEALFREASRRIGGCRSEASDTYWIIGNLAGIRSKQGDDAEAEALIVCLLERGPESAAPPEAPAKAYVLSQLAAIRYRQQRMTEAEAIFRDAFAIREGYHGPDHTQVANAINNLGRVLHSRGEHLEAETLLRRALDIRNERLKPDHPHVANTEKNLAQVLTALGQTTEAEPLARHALTILRSELATDDWRVADAESVLGECLAALGRCPEARQLLSAGYPTIVRAKGEDSPEASAAGQRMERFEALCASSERIRIGPLPAG